MKKPNILLIMADQLTPFMTGMYGNNQVKTPNLDALRARSLMFENAYTPYPLCAPARAALMTSRYVYDMGCYDNASTFSSEEPTFAHYITLLGYETVLSGKMHFTGPDQLHGFHRRLTTDIYPSSFSWNHHKFYDTDKHILQDPWGNACLYTPESTGTREWNSGIQYDEETHFRAMEYLYGSRRADNPFFLCVSYHHPHDPFNPPARYWEQYKEAELDIPEINEGILSSWSTMDRWINEGFHRTDKFDITQKAGLLKLRRCYAALVTYIDDKVGELLHTLKHAGLEDKTVVVFTSDHGDMLGERGMVQKRCFYEWSTRVPLTIAWPDGTFAGETCGTPVSLVDLGATFRAMAGEDPGAIYPPTDGVNLPDIANGGYTDRVIFVEGHGEGVIAPCFMARWKKYKYYRMAGHDDEDRFFDLEADPMERRNLSGEPGYQAEEAFLRDSINGRFSDEVVRSKLVSGLAKRQVIKDAMRLSGTSWDYTPDFPGKNRYSR